MNMVETTYNQYIIIIFGGLDHLILKKYVIFSLSVEKKSLSLPNKKHMQCGDENVIRVTR